MKKKAKEKLTVRKADRVMHQKLNAGLGHLSAAQWLFESLSDDLAKLHLRRKVK